MGWMRNRECQNLRDGSRIAYLREYHTSAVRFHGHQQIEPRPRDVMVLQRRNDERKVRYILQVLLFVALVANANRHFRYLDVDEQLILLCALFHLLHIVFLDLDVELGIFGFGF